MMNSARLKVAVADDERDTREFLEEALTRLGHEVVAVAATGKQLAEKVRVAVPDLILTDIKMPEADGIDSVTELNRERQVPVILVSAHHDAATLSRVTPNYVMGYLVKPVSEADLKTAITMALLRWQQFEAMKKESADLRQALDDRKAIEKAKGTIMKRSRVEEDEAFRRLRKLASDSNMRLVDIAKKVIAAEEVFHDLDRL